jgi:hypothetical protein
LETMWKSIHAVSLIVKLMVTRCLVHNSPCMGADAREARVEHTRSTYLVGRPNAIAAGTRSSLGIGWRRADRYCSCVGNNGVWQVARSSWDQRHGRANGRLMHCRLYGVHVLVAMYWPGARRGRPCWRLLGLGARKEWRRCGKQTSAGTRRSSPEAAFLWWSKRRVPAED